MEVAVLPGPHLSLSLLVGWAGGYRLGQDLAVAVEPARTTLADVDFLTVDAGQQPDAALRRTAQPLVVHRQAKVEGKLLSADGNARRRVHWDGLFGDHLAVLDDDLHRSARPLTVGSHARAENEAEAQENRQRSPPVLQ